MERSISGFQHGISPAVKVSLADYSDRYETINFERRDAIVQLTLHTEGGSLRWGALPVDELQDAFEMVGRDKENRVVILTGTGEEFNGPVGSPDTFPAGTPAGWDSGHFNVRKLLNNLLSLEAPIISAINGPALRHCETPLLCDIVLASTRASFQDSGHFVNGLVPGDGMQLVLPLVMGANRARYFMLTGQTISAEEALHIGMVNEVLEPGALLPRAWELAAQLTKQSPLVLRYTKVAMVHTMRQLIVANQGYGLALEALAAIEDRDRAGYSLPEL
jgi:enoyl-CoA hydratase/carnithine racemase